MKTAQQPRSSADTGKRLAILGLYALSVLIIAAGTVFSILSAVRGTTFPVLNANIPGAVFGLTVVLLGVRYFLSVRRLKARVFRSDAAFSWDNFRRRTGSGS